MGEAETTCFFEVGTKNVTSHRSDDPVLRKEAQVFPYENGMQKNWDILKVSLFLNSLRCFMEPERSRKINQTKDPYCYLKFNHSSDSSFYVQSRFFYQSGRFEIYVSSAWIKSQWFPNTLNTLSNTGTRGRLCVNEKNTELTRWCYYVIKTTDTQQAILNHCTPIFYQIEEFSEPFKGIWNDFRKIHRL